MKTCKGNLIYIPTGENHLGGLAYVLKYEKGCVYTNFGKYSWEILEHQQEELQEKFGTEFAINW